MTSAKGMLVGVSTSVFVFARMLAKVVSVKAFQMPKLISGLAYLEELSEWLAVPSAKA
jgi:hypothetical protein